MENNYSQNEMRKKEYEYKKNVEETLYVDLVALYTMLWESLYPEETNFVPLTALFLCNIGAQKMRKNLILLEDVKNGYYTKPLKLQKIIKKF